MDDKDKPNESTEKDAAPVNPFVDRLTIKNWQPSVQLLFDFDARLQGKH